MHAAMYDSDSGSSAVSSQSSLTTAERSQLYRDRKAHRSPMERAFRDSVAAEVNKQLPLPPAHPSEEELVNMSEQEKKAIKDQYEVERKRVINQRTRLKKKIILQRQNQQAQGQAAMPSPNAGVDRQTLPSPVHGQASPIQFVRTPRGRGVTPSPAGSPMPVRMLSFETTGTGETPQRHRNEHLFELMMEKMMVNNTQQTNTLAAALLSANDEARKDTQDKNNHALETCISGNQKGIQKINDQHKERNMESLKQVVGMLTSSVDTTPLTMDSADGYAPDTAMDGDSSEFVERKGGPTRHQFVSPTAPNSLLGIPTPAAAYDTTTASQGKPAVMIDSSKELTGFDASNVTKKQTTPIAESAKTPTPPIDGIDASIVDKPYAAPIATTAKKRLREKDTVTPVAGKEQRLYDTPMVHSSSKKSASSKRSTGLPPRAPRSAAAKANSSATKALSYSTGKKVAKRRLRTPPGSVTRFIIASPDGTSYTLGDSTGWQNEVQQWSMSRHRASFLLKNGTVAAYPFLKREEEARGTGQGISKKLVHSGEGWRIILIAAHGSHTFTLERDQRDMQRRIKCQTGDQQTKLLEIKGLKADSMIDRLFPGEDYLVVLYQNGMLDLVRGGEVVDSWHEIVASSLGENYGKSIGHVYVGGLFVLVKLLVTEELFCIPLYSDQEGPLKCDINKGRLVLPRKWTGGAGVSCGHNHCVVHALYNAKPEGRAYVAGSNSHFQLGHGGGSSGVLRVVRGLMDRNVTAIFSTGNRSFAIDKAGRLACFGKDWENSINRDGNFQELALADTAQYAMVEESDGNFGLVTVGSTVSPIQVDGKITNFLSMKTGGDHVGVQVSMKAAEQQPLN